MLNAMRKNLKKLSWVLWLVIATFIGTIFAVWGMGGSGGKSTTDRNIVAWIDEQPVTAREFFEARKRVISFYQQVYGDKFDEFEDRLQISETALSQIIQIQALMKAARNLEIAVSTRDVQTYIKRMPYFQVDGRFSKNRYQRLLKMNHMTEKEFVKQIRAEIASERVQHVIKDAVWVSDADLKAHYRLENEKVRLEYLQVNSRYYADKIEPTAAELDDYFEKNKGNYQIPDKVAVLYLEIDPKKMSERETIKNKIQIDLETIEEYYYKNEKKFQQEKEVKASHILVKTAGVEPEQDLLAREKAAKLLAELKAGADFATVAKEHSDDPGSAARGGELGFFKRQGQMVEPFSNAAFALEKGQISDIVKTQFGYHLIKVDDIKEADLKTLADATAEIRETLIHEKAIDLTQQEADRIRENYKPDIGLEALAKRFDLIVAETDLFAAREIVQDLGWVPQFSNAAFELEPNLISQVVKEKDKFYLLVLKEKVEAHQALLEEVKTQTLNNLIEERSLTKARQKMEEIQTQLQTNAEWSSLAEGDLVKIGDTDFFTRKQSIQGIGRDEDIMNQAFQLPISATIGPREIRNMIYMMRVTDKQEPDWTKFAEETEQIRDQLNTSRGDRYFNHWIEKQKSLLEVTKNAKFFEKQSS